MGQSQHESKRAQGTSDEMQVKTLGCQTHNVSGVRPGCDMFLPSGQPRPLDTRRHSCINIAKL